MQENNNIFDESSGCIRQDALLQYLKGKLSGKERNLVEKHLLECKMCSDELEGLTNLSEPERIVDIEAELNSMVDKRTTPRILWSNPKVVYRVAAVAVLTIGVSTLLYYFVLKTTPPTMMSESQMPSVTVEMQDSISNKGVTSIPRDANERSELKKSEGNVTEMSAPVAPIVNKIQAAEDASVADSENEMRDDAEMEEIVLAEKAVEPDSAVRITDDVAVQRTEAVRSANAETKMEEIVTASEGARLSKKLSAFAGESAQPQITVAGAIMSYNKKNYQEALRQFNVLYDQNTNNDTVVYYRAMCSYKLKSFADAIVGFQKLMKKSESEFFYDSQWYCVLSLVEVGRKDEARNLFEAISKSDSPFKNSAAKKIDD